MNRRRIFSRGWVLWLLVFLLLLAFSSQLFGNTSEYKTRPLNQIQTQIDTGNVAKAKINDNKQHLEVDLKDGSKLGTSKASASYATGQADQLANELKAANVDYTVSVSSNSVLLSLLFNFLPILFIVGLLLFFMNSMQGGGSRVMNFGKSKAKLVSKDTPKTTFADVAGADEALEELEEIKDFLASPAKFQAVGAKIPKGVLLYGPPGTGKTLLARAVAGEAGVPFYSISGSDFVEMFVGVGASRVRDLFEQAKTNAPSIIFVDEIDAVGRHRGAGLGGGHDEREQTLNQLLVEMDGFDAKTGVILIAATNRPDILDPALLRPGRFDRQITVDRPDLLGREAILAVHAKGKPMAADIDLAVIARRTPGFTGADLANVLNEAALLTARMDQHLITMTILEESIDRVMAGPERKTRAMSDKEKKTIAYHEGGHALVAHALPNTDPVHKVTILPRGRALGYTMQLPLEDKYLQSRSEMLDQLAVLLGGRTAEELVFHEPTTGASNDIEKATAISRAMVTQYGMSDSLGALKFGQDSGEVFLGRDMGHQRDYSEEVASRIDEEVRRLIEAAHDEAFEVLVEYRDVLDNLVLQLMEKETLTKEQVLEVFAPVQKRSSRGSWTGTGKRRPSSKPPVTTPAELALANGNGHHRDVPAERQRPARPRPAEAAVGVGYADRPHLAAAERPSGWQRPTGSPPRRPPSGPPTGQWTTPPSPAAGGFGRTLAGPDG